MIVGDKIVTVNLTRNGALVPVEVYAIEKHEILWRCRWRGGDAVEQWFVAHARIYENIDSNTYYATGRLQKRAKGVEWAPSWIQHEVDLLQVVAALGSAT